MKKVLKIILVNIFLFCILIFISDIFIYCFKMSKGLNRKPFYFFGYVTKTPEIIGFNLKNFYNNDYKKYKGRFPDGLQYKDKSPIVIFGCSYAFGQGLETNQTFSYKIAHVLKRPVYNRAMAGGSFQHMYYQTADEGGKYFYNEVPPSDIVIYLMMDNHYERLTRYTHFNFFKQTFYPVYHIKNNNFVLDNYKNPFINFIKSSYTVKLLHEYYIKKYVEDINNKDKLINMIVLYCLKTKQSLEKNWNKDINFIVVFYPQIKYDKELKKRLEDNNIKVINIKDITDIQVDMDEKYKQTDGHPNENAWNVITPLIIEELYTKKIIK